MAGQTCACGCGTPVRNKWARGHSARGEGGYDPARHGGASLTPIPGPSDPVWDDDSIDVGELAPDAEPIPAPQQSGPRADAEPGPTQDSGPGLAPPADDEPPAHARRDWHRTSAKPKSKPTRVTAGVRSDIEGKIGFALSVPGSFWAARDPVCGGTFMVNLEAEARVMAGWVVRSPALVEWFMSPAGSGFVLFLDSMAAFGPLVQALFAHHVFHTAGEEPPADALQPNYSEYAA